MISGMAVRVPGVYLSWASLMFLAFFAFNGINNLRVFNVAFSSIPTVPTASPVDFNGRESSHSQLSRFFMRLAYASS